MRPALSVVLFTVLSGAGIGALALIALVELARPLGGPDVAPGDLARTSVVALVLAVAGLLSSTLHLGNPRNAWRSLSRWRTSWLSREAVAALALLPVAAALAAALWHGAAPMLRVLLAFATVALAWTTLYCTSMIYASLKPIRAWHTRHVPAGYLLLGHFSGAVLLVGALRSAGAAPLALTLVASLLLAAAAFVKLDYYAYLAGGTKRVTIEDAIGVAHGVAPPPRQSGPGSISAVSPGTEPGPVPAGSVMRARLLDSGHSRGTFLTHEFGYVLAPRQRTGLRAMFWLAGVIVPAVWLAQGVEEASGSWAALAVCLAGLAAERWLFFAEARHTVRLYHGDATT